MSKISAELWQLEVTVLLGKAAEKCWGYKRDMMPGGDREKRAKFAFKISNIIVELFDSIMKKK